MKFKKLSKAERKKHQSLGLEKKIELAKKVIKQAYDNFPSNKIAIAWTGGKDSTLLLWLVKQVSQELKKPLPKAMFVDEGDVFKEIWNFVDKIVKEWEIDFYVAHNTDVSSQVENLGDIIKVKNLNERNQKEIKRLSVEVDEFPYKPESYIGNHLMKTVATNIWLEKNNIEALMVGVRWDEQEARSSDDFFRNLKNPDHTRVEPILQFSEKEVWQATHKHKIPYVKLYEQGYRSLGAKTTTGKVQDAPAWEQDLENTTERAGRQQDKEKIMKRLRDLGYM